MFGLKGKRKKERRGEEKGTENEIMVGDVERDGIKERGRGSGVPCYEQHIYFQSELPKQ